MHSITVSDAEYEEMKQGAKQILTEYLESGQSPEGGHNLLVWCIWIFRDELLAWARDSKAEDAI